jgi:hypothetical protein
MARTFRREPPKQSIVSLILDVIGAEGMLRPCMHYRWNFDDDNEEFLMFHFQTIYNGENVEQAARERMALIKEVVNPAWGVSPENHDFIESHHFTTLRKLNAHFAQYPLFSRWQALSRGLRHDGTSLWSSRPRPSASCADAKICGPAVSMD